MSESLTSICLKRFCAGVVRVFGETYLRLPSSDYLKGIEEIFAKLGLPGLLGR
jgi:hypothetical protein